MYNGISDYSVCFGAVTVRKLRHLQATICMLAYKPGWTCLSNLLATKTPPLYFQMLLLLTSFKKWLKLFKMFCMSRIVACSTDDRYIVCAAYDWENVNIELPLLRYLFNSKLKNKQRFFSKSTGQTLKQNKQNSLQETWNLAYILLIQNKNWGGQWRSICTSLK